MKRLLAGYGASECLYHLDDPSAVSETEFEGIVVRVFARLYDQYNTCLFAGTFALDEARRRPDLALVAKDFSHWFVVEVELVSHSLEHHVLPQVRAFVYGEPQSDCAPALARGLQMPVDRAESLLRFVPRSVAVVANKADDSWRQALRGVQSQLLVLSSFRSTAGMVAIEVDGDLQAVQQSLGFGRYSAVDRSCRFAGTVRLPLGDVQFVEAGGATATWRVVAADGGLWVHKQHGVPDLVDGASVQVLRTYDGRLLLRCPC